MLVSASTLRNNIYKLLDGVLTKQQPLQIERKGQILEIIPRAQGTKFSRLTKHDCLSGDPEAIVHMDWSGEWKHDLP